MSRLSAWFSRHPEIAPPLRLVDDDDNFQRRLAKVRAICEKAERDMVKLAGSVTNLSNEVARMKREVERLG